MSLGSLPSVLRACPVMVMGADVTHAAPQHQGEKPSIVAVVASTEPAANNMSQAGRLLSPNPTLVPHFDMISKIISLDER